MNVLNSAFCRCRTCPFSPDNIDMMMNWFENWYDEIAVCCACSSLNLTVTGISICPLLMAALGNRTVGFTILVNDKRQNCNFVWLVTSHLDVGNCTFLIFLSPTLATTSTLSVISFLFRMMLHSVAPCCAYSRPFLLASSLPAITARFCSSCRRFCSSCSLFSFSTASCSAFFLPSIIAFRREFGLIKNRQQHRVGLF